MTTITNSAQSVATPATAAGSPAWQRRAAVAGLAFVAFSVASTFVAGAPPASDASTAKVTAHFRQHSGAIKVSLWLGGIGIMALLWWLGALWRMLSRAESERPRLTVVACISLGSALALAVGSGSFTAAGAQRIGDIGDGAQLMYTLSLIFIAAAGFGLSVFLAATCTLNVRARVFPAWTNVVGGLVAAAFVAGTLAVTTDANAINVVNVAAFLGWCVWMVGVSISMWNAHADNS
jgi:hypothetical protein